MSWIFLLYLWWTCLLWCVFIRAKKRVFFLKILSMNFNFVGFFLYRKYILKKKIFSIVLILGYVFLKHNILFYNLDQNVFSVDMKTYFYKILKMISIYVLEMIFYTIILGNTVITVHTALVELLVSRRVIFLEICHTHKSRHTGMCILNWLDFLYWLLIIFFEALPGLITCTCT